VPFTVRGCGILTFLPKPAGLPIAFHCLLSFLPSSVTDPRLQDVEWIREGGGSSADAGRGGILGYPEQQVNAAGGDKVGWTGVKKLMMRLQWPCQSVQRLQQGPFDCRIFVGLALPSLGSIARAICQGTGADAPFAFFDLGTKIGSRARTNSSVEQTAASPLHALPLARYLEVNSG
jgi:hypothetical protein